MGLNFHLVNVCATSTFTFPCASTQFSQAAVKHIQKWRKSYFPGALPVTKNQCNKQIMQDSFPVHCINQIWCFYSKSQAKDFPQISVLQSSLGITANKEYLYTLHFSLVTQVLPFNYYE